ncbi:MAG: hypothetical protein Q8M58_06515, partial [Anaerolineales bacterium]|nr:hypothetical protein [Anaerolineales bacterium]
FAGVIGGNKQGFIFIGGRKQAKERGLTGGTVLYAPGDIPISILSVTRYPRRPFIQLGKTERSTLPEKLNPVVTRSGSFKHQYAWTCKRRSPFGIG